MPWMHFRGSSSQGLQHHETIRRFEHILEQYCKVCDAIRSPAVPKRRCCDCTQEKPYRDFASKYSKKCKQCAEKKANEQMECKRCGQTKPRSFFRPVLSRCQLARTLWSARNADGLSHRQSMTFTPTVTNMNVVVRASIRYVQLAATNTH